MPIVLNISKKQWLCVAKRFDKCLLNTKAEVASYVVMMPCINALDLHHKDASQKDFGISSSGLTRSWEKNKAEADKCVLLCANCHREIHAGYKQPNWVTD